MTITLFSYPQLYNLSDNNPYGLKVATFMKLCGIAFRQEHVVDTSQAPRGQLPYLDDDGRVIGDSDSIIAYLTEKFALTIDRDLTEPQRRTDHLVRRMLDDLYWVMSYSRWRDDRFWPQFRDVFLKTHPEIRPDQLEVARAYNFQRYHYQGIGRYEPDAAYARGVSDLEVLAGLMGEGVFLFGPKPHAVDAGIYGFVANIYFYQIETPLKQAVSRLPNLVAHCRAVHELAAEA